MTELVHKHPKRPAPELVQRAMRLLSNACEWYDANARRAWERQIYPLSSGDAIILGHPFEDDAALLLEAAGLARIVRQSQNPEIPVPGLRLLIEHREKADEILNRYINTL